MNKLPRKDYRTKASEIKRRTTVMLEQTDFAIIRELGIDNLSRFIRTKLREESARRL